MKTPCPIIVIHQENTIITYFAVVFDENYQRVKLAWDGGPKTQKFELPNFVRRMLAHVEHGYDIKILSVKYIDPELDKYTTIVDSESIDKCVELFKFKENPYVDIN